tara:strand:- start:2712 stop:3311 length:600 start_codon:yes stop_codon:yes gene_type:complete
MKSFKDMVSETVNRPKSPDEQNFVDKHVVDKKDHPAALDTQFSGDIKSSKKKKRVADLEKGEDEKIYESSESEMTPEQEKKREEIILSLKKKMGEFKAKYGDDASDVMHATATKLAMKEETEDLAESVLADLKDIVKTKSMKSVKFSDGKKQKVDLTTASLLVSMHDQLNTTNQKKVATMLDDSKQFAQMVQFAMDAAD